MDPRGLQNMAAGISCAAPGRGKANFNIVIQVRNLPRPGGAYLSHL
jgi:hypothetical protein